MNIRNSQEMQSPLIVIGMHRSGTTMMTKVIEKLGIFMGVEKEQNHEAIFFLRLNNWLLSLGCGAWDHPEFVEELFSNEVLTSRVVEKTRERLDSLSLIRYLGFSNWLSNRDMFQMHMRWGWKDPRNTYTLPIWLKLFPQAKVINVYRHGVDVASSLYEREQKILALHDRRNRRNSMSLSINEHRRPIDPSPRCSSLEGAFNLWLEYIKHAEEYKNNPDINMLSVCYEKFLSSPEEELSRIITFLGLDVSELVIKNLTKSIHADRAFAFNGKSELVDFAHSCEKALSHFGYGPNGWK